MTIRGLKVGWTGKREGIPCFTMTDLAGFAKVSIWIIFALTTGSVILNQWWNTDKRW